MPGAVSRPDTTARFAWLGRKQQDSQWLGLLGIVPLQCIPRSSMHAALFQLAFSGKPL
jgi:hypothetical protein